MQASWVEQKPVVLSRHRHTEVVAHALAQPLVGSSTQGQRQIFTQGQKGFKGFIGLHGVPPSSNHRFFESRKSGKSGQTCVVAFDQRKKLVT
jgi:hypothetical protein